MVHGTCSFYGFLVSPQMPRCFAGPPLGVHRVARTDDVRSACGLAVDSDALNPPEVLRKSEQRCAPFNKKEPLLAMEVCRFPCNP
eukprot:s14_g57.t1